MLGICAGIAGVWPDLWRILPFAARFLGTCAALYVFFWFRMLGSGDIKLMAVCVGILGVWDGMLVVFLGALCATAVVLLKSVGFGYVWLRGQEIRLAPYLLAGYGIWMLLAL